MAMEMKGEYIIPVPRAAVWAALNDVEVLKAAIPGCDSINRLSENEIEATVTAIKTNEAIVKGAKIAMQKEWFQV